MAMMAVAMAAAVRLQDPLVTMVEASVVMLATSRMTMVVSVVLCRMDRTMQIMMQP